MQSRYYIQIAGLKIRILIDKDFRNIIGFIKKFEDITNGIENIDVSVSIHDHTQRQLKLSADWKSLSISGPGIDDLTDPFNLIGITQALLRFAAIHLAKTGTFLLHGSSAVLDNKIICFGDDGSSIAKTLGSIETATVSKKYVADEFCFLNTKNSDVFGYSFIPLHLRPTVKKHLETTHRLILPKTVYKQAEAGYFINPSELFDIISGKLDILCYVHFSKTHNILKELTRDEAVQSFKFCIASHIAKLLYPELDRMQFATMTDTTDIKILDEKLIDQIISTVIADQSVFNFVDKISSYKLTIMQPCEIIPLIKAVI